MHEDSRSWAQWAQVGQAVVTETGRPVLEWAVTTVENLFGPTWLADNATTTGIVPLRSADWWPLTSRSAVVRLLELATRIVVVTSQGNAEPLFAEARTVWPNRTAVRSKFAHLCLTLEVAAFAVAEGWTVNYERRVPSGRRPDLWLSDNGQEYLLELTVMGYASDQENSIVPRGLHAGSAGPGTHLESALWSRIAKRIAEKVRQTRGGPPGWIRIDDTSPFFQHPKWSARPLSQRLSDLGHKIAVAVVDAPHVHGIILTGGAGYATVDSTELTVRHAGEVTPGATSSSPQEAVANRPVAMLRGLPGRRQRLTFVVPTTHRHATRPTGRELAPSRWYDRETHWLEHTLDQLGHPTLTEIMPH